MGSLNPQNLKKMVLDFIPRVFDQGPRIPCSFYVHIHTGLQLLLLAQSTATDILLLLLVLAHFCYWWHISAFSGIQMHLLAHDSYYFHTSAITDRTLFYNFIFGCMVLAGHGVNGWAVADTHLLVNGTMRICIPAEWFQYKKRFSEFAKWISHDPLHAEFSHNLNI